MDVDYEKAYHDTEESHWWFVGRRSLIRKILRLEDTEKVAQILDVGCSTGLLLEDLTKENYQNLKGIDLSEKAVELGKLRGVDVTCADAGALPFEDDCFDLVIASDVLEHIEEDGLALREWNRVLKKGGSIFVAVPAFQSLWTRHDDENFHFRRYRKSELMKKASEAGFSVQRARYWNVILFPLALIKRKILNNDEYEIRQTGFSNFVGSVAIGVENLLAPYLSVPFGLSCFVWAKKG